MQRYKEYLEPPNKYLTFFKKNSILYNKVYRMKWLFFHTTNIRHFYESTKFLSNYFICFITYHFIWFILILYVYLWYEIIYLYYIIQEKKNKKNIPKNLRILKKSTTFALSK